MIFYIYLTGMFVIMGVASAERGSRDGSIQENYNADDFFFPLGQGITWPLYIFTVLSYRYGIQRRIKREQLKSRNEKLLRELAPHMDEVERLLAGKRI